MAVDPLGLDDFCGGYWGLWSAEENNKIPELRSWADSVDFSTCFEYLIITMIPTAFIVLCGFIRSMYLYKTRSAQHSISNDLFVWKQTLAVIVSAILIGELVYRTSWLHAANVQLFSSGVMILGAVLAFCLCSYEHRMMSRSSGVLTLFWMLTLISDGVRIRTVFLRYEHSFYDTAAVIFLVVRFVFVLASFIFSMYLESEGQYSVVAEDERLPCPETQATLFSRIFFFWISPLLKIGFQRTLLQDDLWSINPEDRTSSLTPKFFKAWKKESTKPEPSLRRALHEIYGGIFWTAGVFKLCQDLLGFVAPVILQLLVQFVSKPYDEPTWQGYVLVATIFGAAELQSILLHQYFHRVMTLGMRLRSSVMAAVYNKSLVLSVSAKQKTTTGEMVNLMAVDAQRFMDLTSYLHLIWSAPLQIGLSLYFLWAQMDVAVLGGVGIMIIMIPLNAYIAQKTRKQQVLQMKQKDQRIKLMNEVLNGMKVIKLYAWEEPYEAFITKVREQELKVLKDSSYLGAFSMFSWSCAPFFVSLVTFMIYTKTGNTLTPEKAFVSLSLFNILRFPMTMLPMMISSLVEAQVSVNRLKNFLLMPELKVDGITRLAQPDASNDAISIKNGTFAWSAEPDKEACLKDITFSVEANSLIAIIGPVGSGKSSCVAAMLGEMEKRSGSVVIPSSIAYVPQQAWIQNASLRDNVIFGLPFDATRYKQAIAACALEPDLLILPAGDMTEIGEKGINLSGGQKQRVSLARAVYQAAACYIFDDPLSAVDAHVGKHIFDQVIGPHGLLHNKTRVLVTHGIHFLPQTSKVVVLKDGRMTEYGTYETLLANNGDFAHLILEHTKNETSTDPTDSTSQPETTTVSGHTTSSGTVSNTTAVASTLVSRAKPEATPSKGKDDKDVEKAKLIDKEKISEGDVKRVVYVSYFKANGYKMCMFILFLYFLTFGTSIYSNIWLSDWSSNGDNPGFSLDLYLGVYAALGLGNAIGMLVVSLVSALTAVNATRILHERMLKAILRSPMSFFDATPIGRLVNRFSKDVYSIDETIPRSLRSYITTALQVLGILAVVVISTPIFLVAIVPMGFLYYYIQKYYVATSRQLQRIESTTRSPIYALFSETLNGVSSIRAYGRTMQFSDLNSSKVDLNMLSYYPNVCANRWLALRLEFLGNFVILLASLFAVIQRETVDPGLVGLSLSYAFSVTQTLNWMVRMSSQLETDIVAVERVEEYVATPPEQPLFLAHRPASAWPAKGEVSFENFSVRYREGLDLVLRNFTCKINGGEKIGIVGRTGAGKSSLSLALFRLIEPAGGRIVVDGEDISKIGLQDLRSNLTVMPQDPVLFCGSVRDNLDPFHNYSDEKIWLALATVQLTDPITALGGLASKVAEGGDNFSVGQRQLICLARAVLRKTKVLVLDEATAAVDLETDQFIQNTIRTEFKECTVLTIAHRINTILDCDRVMVLDKGEIVEFDSPASLFEQPNGVFRAMAAAAGIRTTIDTGIQ